MTMKTKSILLGAIALTTLAACSTDDYVGTTQPARPDAIIFSGGNNKVTRADVTGANAAALLNNTFRVFATVATNPETVVFDNYVVDYNGNIGSDSTNTHGWTYLGQTSLGVNPAVQTVKYWDLSAPAYNFVAFAGIDDDLRISSSESNTVKVNAGNMQKLFVADRVTAKYDASSTGITANVQYGKGPVTFNFKRVLSRIRLGIYETVPGYAVKDVKFYYDDNYLAQAGTSTKTVAGLRGDFPVQGSYTFTYDANNAVEASFSDLDRTTANNFQFGELVYTKAQSSLLSGGYLKEDGTVDNDGDEVFLSTTSAEPTWAKKDAVLDGQNVSNSMWQPILPFAENQTNLVLRVDFTLVSVDGVGAPINVKGASAVVPVSYAQWKPNYAYTYIFKISDKTTGTTGEPNPNPSDPDTPNPNPEPGVDPGLYPITFDATVSSVEDYEQETITIITNLGGDAITTYSVTSDVTNADEYHVGEEIIVSSITHGRWAVAYSATETTEKQVSDNNTYTYTTLAGAAADGKTVEQNSTTEARFTVEKAGYYIVWLHYLPIGLADKDDVYDANGTLVEKGNYVDVFKVVKTVN